jgi:hypothetical protein
MNTTTKELGIVEFSGKVVVADPRYDRDARYVQTGFPVLPGRYHVYTVHSHIEDVDTCVAALLFRHEDCDQIPFHGWKDVEAEIGVDSGQCGVFDESIFPQSKDRAAKETLYKECWDITSFDDQAGILQSRKGAVSSSGYGHGSYNLSVIKHNGANVALLLDYGLVETGRVVRAVRAAMGGYEMLDIAQIMDRVNEECTAFREETQQLTGKQIYDKAYEIFLVENMDFLICERLNEYEDEDDILSVLEQLIAAGGFLPAFMDWALDQDSVDVSNVEKSYETLAAFCEYILNK